MESPGKASFYVMLFRLKTSESNKYFVFTLHWVIPTPPQSSTNEGDVVLDAYYGCGTTVAVAEKLNRPWIGIDITYQSISLILKRLRDTHAAELAKVMENIQLDGVPRDMESAVALAHRKDDRTRKEFEKWAVLTYSNNQAKINDKKGADAGIDGIAYFMVDKDNNGKAIFQVKSGGANRATMATLNSDRQRTGRRACRCSIKWRTLSISRL